MDGPGSVNRGGKGGGKRRVEYGRTIRTVIFSKIGLNRLVPKRECSCKRGSRCILLL